MAFVIPQNTGICSISKEGGLKKIESSDSSRFRGSHGFQCDNESPPLSSQHSEMNDLLFSQVSQSLMPLTLGRRSWTVSLVPQTVRFDCDYGLRCHSPTIYRSPKRGFPKTAGEIRGAGGSAGRTAAETGGGTQSKGSPPSSLRSSSPSTPPAPGFPRQFPQQSQKQFCGIWAWGPCRS